MSRRGEDMLISSVLLLAALLTLTMVILFGVGMVVGVEMAWREWGW